MKRVICLMVLLVALSAGAFALSSLDPLISASQ